MSYVVNPFPIPEVRNINCLPHQEVNPVFVVDPRKKALLRRGAWRNQAIVLDRKWKFAEDRHSHEVSESRSKHKLTGESAGRQIWYCDESEDNDDHFVVVEDFNPSENPNSSDQIFRSIMLNKW
jgi:hypothetical protein